MPQILDSKRSDTETRKSLARLLELGEDDKAEVLLKELLIDSPDDVSLLNARGSIFAKKGDLDNAENLFLQAIKLDGSHADCHYNLGLLHSRQGRIPEAIDDFLKAIEINPYDWAAQNDLGVMYHNQGKTLLAKGHFIKSLEANPLFKFALINLFEICWDYGSYSEALFWIEKYLQNVPKDEKENISMNTSEQSNAVKSDNNPKVEPVIHHDTQTKGSLKIKRKSTSKADEIFNKHVPAELQEKKTGMNIAVVADFNIAGQLSLLFRMINRYTVHKARMVILQGDYLSYDKDIILSENKPELLSEAYEIIKNADFFHIGRFPVNFGDIDWNKILRPDNSILQYYGSEIRQNARQIYEWHKNKKIAGISAWDYTMLENAPLFYHVNIMCDMAKIRPCKPPKDVVRICHPPTNRAFKKTDYFLSVMENLKKKYPVEVELIEKKSNDECLEIKSRCHITFDQISVGIYGLSAIESMATGHAVLCGMSNFASSYHPDNPIVYVDEKNLSSKIEYLLNNKEKITSIGNAGRIWARQNHDPHKIIRQYLWMYDLVKNGHRLVSEPDAYILK